jgi:hypothetical protein
VRDGDGEVRLRDPRLKKIKHKPWVSGETQRDLARRAPARSGEASAGETPARFLLSLFFFLILSLFFLL